MITVKEEFIRCDKLRRAYKTAGPGVLLLWLAMKSYASEHLTDGFVPGDDVDALVDVYVDASEMRRLLRALISCGRRSPDGSRGRGLVEEVEHGYQLHDYLEHEQSAEDARERKRKKADRQKRWKDARKAKQEVDAGDASGDVSGDAAETSSRREGDASPAYARAPVLLSSPLLHDQCVEGEAQPPRRKPRVRNTGGVLFPDGWRPTEPHRKRAAEYRLDCDHEAERFEAHHRAKGTRSCCWNSSFTTWLMNSKKYRDQDNANQLPSENEETSKLAAGFIVA